MCEIYKRRTKVSYLYRIGVNKQIVFHSKEDLTDEEAIAQALSRTETVKPKFHVFKGLYGKREYKQTEYDREFLRVYKPSEKAMELKELYETYKRVVSFKTEIIAGYFQFISMLDKLFEKEKRRISQVNGNSSKRLYYFMEIA